MHSVIAFDKQYQILVAESNWLTLENIAKGWVV